MILCPTNNTDYLNVSAYMEAFWGYLWPTIAHGNVRLKGKWKAIKFRGLKEFVDHIVSVVGRDPLKPTTECLKGVASYPKGDMVQGRCSMVRWIH